MISIEPSVILNDHQDYGPHILTGCIPVGPVRLNLKVLVV